MTRQAMAGWQSVRDAGRIGAGADVWFHARTIMKGGQGQIDEVVLKEAGAGAATRYACKTFFSYHSLQQERAMLLRVCDAERHMHIVYPVAFDQECILFPLYETGDLFDYVLKRVRLPEDEGALIVFQLTSALAHLHDHNIAHRDVKLENVLFDPAHGPVLNDFGHSCIVGPNGHVCVDQPYGCCHELPPFGSRHYRPPEVLQGGLSFDCRAADMWSLGICAYVVCTGRFPISEEALFKLLNYFNGATKPHDSILIDPRQQEGLTTTYFDAVGKCLQVNANHRMTAKQALKVWASRFFRPRVHFLDADM